MYNKENFAVGNVSSKNRGRYNLNSIYCHPKYTVGCDGHRLMIVTAPKMDVAEMPVPENGELTDKFDPFILDLNDSKKVEKSIPKKSVLPILQYVAILKSDNGNAKFFTTDLQSQNITVSRKIEGEYPQFGKTFPKGKAVSIRVDTSLLKGLIEAVEDAQGYTKNPYVDIEIRNGEAPIVLKSRNVNTNQKITALLMPLKK